MITGTPTTLHVCVDCLMLLANGEVFDAHGDDITAQHAAKIDAIWGDTELTLGHVDAEEESDAEPWFSWQPCDGCGSTLGGDREYATAWTEEA